MKDKNIYAVIVVIIFIAEIIGCKTYMKNHPIIKNKIVYTPVKQIVYKNKKGVIIDITYKNLAQDLVSNYNFLSKNQQVQILQAIKKASEKYNINPLVIYSLISVESSFRFWIKSPTRLVKGYDGKRRYDNAQGLMSVVPSIWMKNLRKNKIVFKASELYQIEPNIMAGSFILKTLIKRNKGNSIRGLEAYFGKSAYAKIYQHKIRAKIGSLFEKEILRSK